MTNSSRLADSLNLSVSAAGLEDLTMSESKGDQLKETGEKLALTSARCFQEPASV